MKMAFHALTYIFIPFCDIDKMFGFSVGQKEVLQISVVYFIPFYPANNIWHLHTL